MQKIVAFVAFLVLSFTASQTFAKEASTEQQKTLSKVEEQALASTKTTDKTEEIKLSTLEKIEKQLNELDAQKNERMKVEIE